MKDSDTDAVVGCHITTVHHCECAASVVCRRSSSNVQPATIIRDTVRTEIALGNLDVLSLL